MKKLAHLPPLKAGNLDLRGRTTQYKLTIIPRLILTPQTKLTIKNLEYAQQ